jgi:hypothetical protein
VIESRRRRERARIARRGSDHRVAVTLGVLAQLEPFAGDAQRAARECHIARIDDRLLQIVADELVGDDLGGFVAVGPLRLRGGRKQQRQANQKHRGRHRSHR